MQDDCRFPRAGEGPELGVHLGSPAPRVAGARVPDAQVMAAEDQYAAAIVQVEEVALQVLGPEQAPFLRRRGIRLGRRMVPSGIEVEDHDGLCVRLPDSVLCRRD